MAQTVRLRSSPSFPPEHLANVIWSEAKVGLREVSFQDARPQFWLTRMGAKQTETAGGPHLIIQITIFSTSSSDTASSVRS